MRANELKLNLNRTEVLLLGSSLSLERGCIQRLAGVALTPKTSVQFGSVLAPRYASGYTDTVCGQECIFAALAATPAASLLRLEPYFGCSWLGHDLA